MISPAPTTVSPQARFCYLAISSIVRRHLSTSCRRRSTGGTFHRSDFTSHSWTGVYEPGGPTEGPLRDASTPPRITPTRLKEHLDSFVVGQDRAKRTLATAVYNHYQRVQELERRDEEELELQAREERRRMAQSPRHPVEDEFPGQQQTTTLNVGPVMRDGEQTQQQQMGSRGGQRAAGFGGQPPSPPPLLDTSPLSIEKSNILLLGPSGVGKTLMAKTLARVLEVPFSMSDCTPFTQAGYIGEDAEVCVQRLLAAANYDVARAERGIICLDEMDKIATAKVSHGKDVGGEGVQQALLKIIEGTTLQIQAKAERGSTPPNNTTRSAGSQGYPTNSPLSGGNMGSGQQSASSTQKGETYNVKTDNILFICAGAFTGLHKMILDRISKGSIGFGATVRAAPSSSSGDSNQHETILEGEDELFEKHLPFYTSPTASPSSTFPSNKNNNNNNKPPPKRSLNTLDLVEPQDLQKYGLIPELVGRIPIACALSSLSIPALVKVLTEPRNSILKQYETLFALSSIELRFTTPALHIVASTASKMGTGARGLRTVMERLLADAMFEAPGSGVRFVLVSEAVAERREGVVMLGKESRGRFHGLIAEEEERWEERVRREEDVERGADAVREGLGGTFEEYRGRVGMAAGGAS